MSRPMRALTLHAEWAWAVCHLGKAVENRPEMVARMLARYDGVLAIHAGKSIGGRPGWRATANGLMSMVDHAERAGWQIELPEPDYLRVKLCRGARSVEITDDDIQTSAIVALCRTGNPLSPDEGRPWQARGSWAVELVDVQLLPEPVPCRGAQGLWTVPDNIAARVVAQSPARGEE